MTIYKSILLATLVKVFCIGACAAQTPDPLSDWSNVAMLQRGSEIIVVAQTTRLCVLDHVDAAALYCEHAVASAHGHISFVLATDRDTIQTVLLNRTASEAAARRESYHLGALSGAVLGGVSGALITKKSADGLQGVVGGALAGAVAGLAVAAVAQRHHAHGATVIYQAPANTSRP